MKLNELSDNKGARRNRVRVGRGIGSGKGKTGGRGVKGQKSRSGVAIHGFEGGQMPLHMRLPKRGFTPPYRKKLTIVNVGRLQQAIDNGKLKADGDIDEQTLVDCGVVRRKLDGLRLLGDGEVTSALSITAYSASKGAIESIEKAGGKVTLVRPQESSDINTGEEQPS